MSNPIEALHRNRRSIVGALLSIYPAMLMAASNTIATAEQSDVMATGLLFAGIIFLILEIKIVSFGILGVVGSACLALSGMVVWMQGDGAFWGIPLSYYVPLLVLILLPLLALGVLGARAYKQKISSGSEGFVGELAQASEALAPQGRVFFQGTYWQAVSQTPVAAGAVVRVTGVDRLTLFVEPVNSADG